MLLLAHFIEGNAQLFSMMNAEAADLMRGALRKEFNTVMTVSGGPANF